MHKTPNALVSPSLDFWLLGGASVIVYVLVVLAQGLKDYSFPTFQQLNNIPAAFGILSLVVNYPHFMYSYKLGYGRGFGFIKAHWFSLILTPLIIGLTMAIAYFQGNISFLGFMKLAMLILVGWHYGKQVYGCMMVYSKYDGYPIDNRMRNVLKFHIYSIVIFNIIIRAPNANKFLSKQDVPTPAFFIPDFFKGVAAALFVASTLLVIYFVFYKTFKNTKKKPSPTFLIPWVAFLIWWLPIKDVWEYTYYVVPFFHSLQYLPFVYKFEKPDSSASGVNYRLGLNVVAVAIIGFLAFEMGPAFFDNTLKTVWAFKLPFFLIAIPIFINIHHYFIDSVVWKFGDPQVRAKLL